MSGYCGTVDDDVVGKLMEAFGTLVTDAGEVGFILTYHAVDEPGTGRMNLAGSGISQEQLEVLLADALRHNAEHGSTS